ncbi:hypothetical protein JCM8115_001237 [Rhodotorula mucilaginosa]|uniref:Essential protein Yae1 N-terminal domain-containing protein n=1 Tax=Rhodotorula mucilaginosa TaxID=5537 RepID=A0A9P6VYM9_RHOMI|nr:hypothetical protein C6P46_005610 [Rhodotorula mucilaginosa]TKA52450.1 hypothetical protein B0A53_05158 [Rhodotorula sp. CCFEE 5036]
MVAGSNNAAEPAHASFDGLLELEQTFYQAGFDGGFPHGELHGLFEGRELGREKSWELWEEIGYYEGTAKLWQAILQNATPGNVSRSQQSLQAIRALVSAFPASNDSSTLRDESIAQSSDVDINAQLGALRSKYRTSCALVGMRPRMAVSAGSDGSAQKGEDNLRSLGSTM